MPKGRKQTDVSELANNPSMLARAKDAARYLISGVRPDTWMSPGQPQIPMAPAAPPRAFDYPVGINYTIKPRPYEPGIFENLRGLADGCGILRLVIETRKDQMEAVDWQIKPRTESAATPDDPRIKALQKFLRKPDGRLDWNTWLRQILEEMFVTDAVTIYKQRDMNGRLIALEQLDGATIALKVDETGRLPFAPDPAYQQIIKGVVAADYTRDELLYLPRNSRAHRLYGYSPVEQVQMEVNIAIRRSIHQLAYYTDGNMTNGIFWLPPDWSPDQVKAMQTYWNDMHVGNLQERRVSKMLPGNKDSYQSIVEPPLKDLYDEWLARVICFAFSVSAEALISKMNRATAETSHDTAMEQGLAPLQNYVKRMMDSIIADEFDAPDLEFTWVDDREVDGLEAANIDAIYVKNGIKTIDEVRDSAGLDQMGGAASRLGVITAVGFAALPSEELIDAKDKAGIVGSEAVQNPPETPPSGGGGKEPAAGDGQANESNDAAEKLLKKKPSAPRLDRGLVRHSADNAQKKASQALKATARSVAHQLAMRKLAKADDDIADGLDLSKLGEMAGMASDLTLVAKDSGMTAAASVGVRPGDKIFNQVNQNAVDWANDQAAQLVSQVTDTTRDMIRSTIKRGLADNIGLDEIANNIGSDYAFSDDRAALIANTEVADANSAGALQGYKGARDIGIKVKKAWLTDGECCDICLANEDAGPIDLDDTFPSGDDAPTAHPRCECALTPVVED